MIEQTFNTYWNENYPETIPISHELKSTYPERWFRIHSLPNSKRYASNDHEYEVIYSRQNALIEYLVGTGEEIFIAFGLYDGNDISNQNYNSLKDFKESVEIQKYELHNFKPDEYEDETIYKVYVKNDIWKIGTKNNLLKAIADDEIGAIIACPSKNVLIAPYDGGVDIIVNSPELQKRLKLKFKDWLSEREDGL